MKAVVMVIRAVVFDIGGVLEITPDLGVIPMWESRRGSFLVDDIVYSHEAGMSKPDPRIYALACTRLGVRPDETVFIDDTDYCVAGARELGLHAVRYLNNAQVIHEIEVLLAGS